MTENEFDVVIIGAGPGGYVAAIRCAQLGLKTACIDRWVTSSNTASPGGTCLNVGCIPSKALLESSERYEQMQLHASDHGIAVTGISVDVPKMQTRKDKVVRDLTGGITALFKSNKVTFISGHGVLANKGRVDVTLNDGSIQNLHSRHVILASGSTPVSLPGIEVNNETIFDSSGALEFQNAPKTLGIIGAGVIGLELGSVWRRLGSSVVILEAQESLLPIADPMIAREAKKQFTQQGLDIRLSCKVNKVQSSQTGCVVEYQSSEGQQKLEVERLIVAVGRRPYSDRLLGPECGLKPNDRGLIDVDDKCESALPGVWAIGDLVRGPMLAHKASEEGIAVAEQIATGISHVDLNIIPWVIYTHPEIAWVGATESELKASSVDYNAGIFPFAASGRAQAVGATAGFIKILADNKTDRILGVHLIGKQASEMVNEAVFAMSMEATAEDLARTVHAHPTLGEAMHEAALASDRRAIHKANR